MMVPYDFLATSLIVALIPGTGVVYTLSTALARGRRAGFYASLGCTLGIVPHLLATILGLAALLHASALAFQTLKYAGVAYLLYVAYGMLSDKSAFSVGGDVPRGAAGTLVLRAVLLNLLNPKLTIFFLAFLPQFVAHDAPNALSRLLLLSGVFMAVTFAVFLAYAFLAHAFRRAVIDSARVQAWLRRGFAAAFVGLGVHLAFSEK